MITRFRYIEVLFHIFYYYWGKKYRLLYRGLHCIQLFRERLWDKVYATTRGWSWVHCFSKKSERMAREAVDICLRVLKESNKSNWSRTFFPTTFLERFVLSRFHCSTQNTDTTSIYVRHSTKVRVLKQKATNTYNMYRENFTSSDYSCRDQHLSVRKTDTSNTLGMWPKNLCTP